MTLKTYSAEQIANFILASADPDDNDISNLKMQKLCYYAQGMLTAMRGTPLFHETIEAWDHGPVVPELYHKYKRFGSSNLDADPNFKVEEIDERDRNALYDICEYYGQYSAWRLRNMTHEEKPWMDAHKTRSDITIDALVEFFAPQIEDDYRKKIYG
ncbi:MAG: DUF4065 domain-containing protein [Xanthobacteraceae bacterium]|nr:DUF4065 domain-containing protein [Xanthobacteraceae bacterium]